MQKYLAELRQGTDEEEGLSIQTSNHYLRAIKQFSRWLVRDRRTNDDPLVHLAMLNVKVDRRHDRRALSADEFARLVEAAACGPPVVCIPGPDRAIMFVLSAWTGYRKAEIGSLTKRSLRLDDDPPTVTVAACYSKRKRQDTQVLHPEVAKRLRDWLETKKNHGPDDLLFPVSAKVPGGTERRTSKIMRVDLKAAKKKCVEEGASDEEKEARRNSGVFAYQDENGLFADFHSNRHTFITNLERAGVSPRTAQSLARHCDIRLTMNTYTHIGLHDQTTAIESLPASPSLDRRQPSEAAELRATGTDDACAGARKVPTVVPRGAENGAGRLAPNTYRLAPNCTDERGRRPRRMSNEDRPKALTSGTLRAVSPPDASLCITGDDAGTIVRSEGLEPPTLGSEDCSPDAVKSITGNHLRQPPEGEVPTVVPSSSHADFGLSSPPLGDPELAGVAAAWIDLPDAIKAGILALVKAAGGDRSV